MISTDRQFRLTHATTHAVTSFLKLSADKQLRVAGELSRPLALQQCPMAVQPLARKRGVRRFRVSDSLRICFRVAGGRACLLHASEHAEYERFLSSYRGQIPERLIPLQETVIMAKHKSNETNGTTASKGRNETLLPLEADVHLVAQSLAQALTSYAEKTRTSVNDDILAATEVLSSELQQQLAKSEKELSTQQQRLSKLERLSGRVDKAFVQLEKHRGGIAAHLEHLKEVRAIVREQSARLDNRVDAIAERFEQLESARPAEVAANNTLADSVVSLRLSLERLEADKANGTLRDVLKTTYGIAFGSYEKIRHGGVSWFPNVGRRAYRLLHQLAGAVGRRAMPRKKDLQHPTNAG